MNRCSTYTVRGAAALAASVWMLACTAAAPSGTPSPEPAIPGDTPLPETTAEPTRAAALTPESTLAPTPTRAPATPLDADIEREGLRARLGKGVVVDLALSPDGQYLAAGTTIGVYLYRFPSFEEVWAQPTSRQASALRFSGDGSQVYAGYGYSDSGLVVWDAASGSSVQIVHTEGNAVVGIAPDASQLVVSTDDGGLLWSTADGTSQPLPAGLGMVWDAEWSPDGSMLALSFDQLGVVVLDAAGEEVVRLPTGQGRQDILWSPDGSLIAVQAGGQYLTVWQLDGAQLLDEATWGFGGAAWSPEPPWRIAGLVNDEATDYETWLSIWTIPDQGAAAEPVRWPGSDAGEVENMAWSPDGSTIVGSGTLTGNLYVWDTQSGEQQIHYQHSGDIRAVAINPQAKMLAAGVWNGPLTFWDLETGAPLPQIDLGLMIVMGAAWSPDGTLLAVAEATNDSLLLYDTASWQRVDALAAMEDSHAYLEDVAWSPDGGRIAASHGNTTVVWDRESGSSQYLEGDHPLWSPDGARLATAWNAELFIWDAITGERLLAVTSEQDYIPWFGWLADGAQIATATQVWDAATGDLISSLTDRPYGVPSPDGSLIAGPSGEEFSGEATIWDAQTGEALAVLAGHPWYIGPILWSPDGSLLIVSTNAGAISVWDVAALLP